MTRILIAEDDRRGRYLLETLLRAYGYEVTSAKNGAEALGLARQNPPDLVVTDLLMPVMDGFELCRQWKSDGKLKGIPFVVYTATYTGTNDEKLAYDLGADRFIVKPQEPEALAKIVHDLLEEHKKTEPSVREPVLGEAESLRQYNAVLFEKLEKKVRELEESERRHRILVELTSDFTYVIRVEPDGTAVLESCSDAFTKITGYTADDLNKMGDWSKIVHPDDRARFAERRAALLKGQGQVTEFRLVTKEGEVRWMADYARAGWDEAETRVSRIIGAAQNITQRKQAEAALRESERGFREVLENVTLLAVKLDCRGRILFVNDHLLQSTGWKAEEILGRDWFELFIPPGDGLKERFFESVGRGTIFPHMENDLLTRQGETRRIVWNNTVLRDAHGNMAGTTSIGEDITDRKKAEEALALHVRIADIFLTIPDEGMFNEVLRVVLEVLRSPFGVFGYIDEDGANVVPTMTRQVWDKCRVPDKTIRFPRETWGDSSWPRALLGKNTIYSNAPSAQIPDGHLPIRRHISTPILFEGKAIGLFQVANKETDYTEADILTLETLAEHVAPILSARLRRQQAENALKDSESLWKTTFNAMSDWISIISPDGRILRSNESARPLFGLSREKLVGQSCHRLVHGTDAPPDFCPVLKMAGSGHRETAEFRTPDGKKWLSVVVDPVRDADGKVTGAVHTVRDITERKETEKALRDSLQTARALLDQTFEFIGVLTPEGILIDANRTALDASGVEKSDVIGKRFWEAPWWKHSPELQDRLRAAVKKAAAGEFVRFEATHPSPDGSLLNVDFSLKPVRDESGRVTMLIPEGRDMTEHRKTLKALHDSERFLSNIIENIPDMIFVKDARDLRFVRFNRAGENLLGYGREELIGKSDHDFFPKDEAESFVAKDREVLREMKLLEIPEEVIKTRHLGERLLHTKKIPILDEEGDPRYLLGISEDITERKRAEESARADQRLFEEIVNAIPVRVFWKDRNLVYLGCNAAFAHDAGFSDPRDLVGKDDYQMAWRAQADLYRADDRQVIESGGPKILIEEPQTTPEGKTLTLLTNKLPLRDSAGKVIGVLGTYMDITERKNAEERFNALGRMEAVGQLAGGVAHDFNNLLTVINSYSALAIENLPPADPLRTDLEEIFKAGERGAALTKQLLAFSRKQVIRPETLNLNDIVAEMREMLRRLVRENIKLKTRLAPDLRNVRADTSQIQQVVMNLVVNARDAMPKGGTLTIETANVDLDEGNADRDVAVVPGPFVLLAVSDTGGGMSEETKKHLFEPFFTTKEPGHGTGLGLATVYGIVKQGNGYVWAYSEPGKGSTLKVYLPGDLSGSERVERVVKEPARSTGTETLLVVEDEDSVRKIAQRVLTAAGYRVLTADDGAEALLAFGNRKTPIDLLLTDVVMPKMSGRDLARELTKIHRKMRVVYMSGYTQDVITHQGVLDPGARLIEKPFAAADLTRTVREVLDAPAETAS